MRIRTRVFLPATLLLSVFAGPLIPRAVGGSGTTVAIPFAGSVLAEPPGSTIVLPPNVLAADGISGSFSYFSGQSGLLGVYAFTNSTPAASLIFAIPTPGFTPSQFSDVYKPGAGILYTVTITDAKSGPGATLDIHAQMSGGTINKPNASADIILTSTTYTGKLALPTAEGATPTTTDISSFLKTPGTLKWDPDGIGFTATLTQFNGFNVQSVPEPSSLVMASLALVTCTAGFLISRRKVAAVAVRA
jgi:hypothetical protein